MQHPLPIMQQFSTQQEQLATMHQRQQERRKDHNNAGKTTTTKFFNNNIIKPFKSLNPINFPNLYFLNRVKEKNNKIAQQ
ncbi:hypothetical protein P8452_51140 [Trifolium repens]|jgi:hypothetical protein|nr:hypothetical protein P8452_51140 [Trifolium repens]